MCIYRYMSLYERVRKKMSLYIYISFIGKYGKPENFLISLGIQPNFKTEKTGNSRKTFSGKSKGLISGGGPLYGF